MEYHVGPTLSFTRQTLIHQQKISITNYSSQKIVEVVRKTSRQLLHGLVSSVFYSRSGSMRAGNEFNRPCGINYPLRFDLNREAPASNPAHLTIRLDDPVVINTGLA